MERTTTSAKVLLRVVFGEEPLGETLGSSLAGRRCEGGSVRSGSSGSRRSDGRAGAIMDGCEYLDSLRIWKE
jgi:hypothetical protein